MSAFLIASFFVAVVAIACLFLALTIKQYGHSAIDNIMAYNSGQLSLAHAHDYSQAKVITRQTSPNVARHSIPANPGDTIGKISQLAPVDLSQNRDDIYSNASHKNWVNSAVKSLPLAA